MDKLRTAILGATGLEGQEFLNAFYQHPLFEVRVLAASERSAGKRHRDACKWSLEKTEAFDVISDERVVDALDFDASDVDIIFSALPTDSPEQKDLTGSIESRHAETKPVFSITSAHRYDD